MSTDIIFGLGDDALTNMFEISFPEGFPTGGNADNVALRCDMQLQIPEQRVNTYPIFKKGVKVDKSGTLTETTKEFTTEFRVDQDWDTVQAVVDYCNSVYDPITGVALPDTLTRTTVLCTAVNTQNEVMKVFRFKNAKPIAWSPLPFDNNASDPIRCTITWSYIDLKVENA
jgi:hypothetical protein